MNIKGTIIGVIIGATLTGGSIAVAQMSQLVPDAFGFHGTPPVTLNANCSRAPVDLSMLSTRRALATMGSIIQAENKCEDLRTSRIINCAKRAKIVEKSDHGVGNPGDESGLGKFVACVAAVNGVK